MRVLDVLLRQHLGTLFHDISVDPIRYVPVFLRDDLVLDLGLCVFASLSLELLSEGYVVDKSPRVVELVVPSPLEVFHGLDQLDELLIANEGQQCGIDAIAVGIVGVVVVAVNTMQGLGRFVGFCIEVRTRHSSLCRSEEPYRQDWDREACRLSAEPH